MKMWEIILLIVAVVVLVFVRKYCWVRVSKKRKTRLYISVLWAAFAAALGVWVLTHHFYDKVAERAHGTHGWASNGLFRWMLIIMVPVAIGYWIWIWISGKSCED